MTRRKNFNCDKTKNSYWAKTQNSNNENEKSNKTKKKLKKKTLIAITTKKTKNVTNRKTIMTKLKTVFW